MGKSEVDYNILTPAGVDIYASGCDSECKEIAGNSCLITLAISYFQTCSPAYDLTGLVFDFNGQGYRRIAVGCKNHISSEHDCTGYYRPFCRTWVKRVTDTRS